MKDVSSPITGKSNCEHVESIYKNTIVDLYASDYNVDVSHYFEANNTVEKYRCLDTKLEFFKPDELAGTGELYEQLQKFDWFYKESKWEYSQALKFIKPGCNVLDIGCGHGHFLQLCNSLGANSTGLEFNEKAYEYAKLKELTVYQESIEEHSIKNDQFYDVVCTFQVLEHVVNVKSFITACLDVLKPGGYFVVGVPNNDSFLKFDKSNALNLPPHHMLHWGRKSLESLPDYFRCNFHSIITEPLSETSWFQQVMEKHYLKNRIVRSIFYRVGGSKLFKRFIEDNAGTIAGHTILAVYQKIE